MFLSPLRIREQNNKTQSSTERRDNGREAGCRTIERPVTAHVKEDKYQRTFRHGFFSTQEDESTCLFCPSLCLSACLPIDIYASRSPWLGLKACHTRPIIHLAFWLDSHNPFSQIAKSIFGNKCRPLGRSGNRSGNTGFPNRRV